MRKHEAILKDCMELLKDMEYDGFDSEWCPICFVEAGEPHKDNCKLNDLVLEIGEFLERTR
jgi:hypothetical protein